MFTVYKKLPGEDWGMVAYRADRAAVERLRIELEAQGYRVYFVPCPYTIRELRPIEPREANLSF